MTTQSEPIVGFFKHAELEGKAKRLITRASGLYWAKEDASFHTELLLFNYWLHKNHIEEPLRLEITLRTLDGREVARRSQAVDFKNAFTLRVRDELERAGKALPFEGSIELEIFSTRDLVVPYPAVIVRHSGPTWHSMTHTSPRVLSETSGDEPARILGAQATNEGNWTIPPPDRGDAFFIVNNGPLAVEPHELRLTLTNHAGLETRVVVPNVAYAPFETRIFWLRDHVDLTHLEGRPGCVSVQTVVRGVFPRMHCGTRGADGSITLDHSNFNYTGDAGLADTSAVAGAGSTKPLGFFVPAPTGDGWSSYLDIYPTYPERDYAVDLRGFDREGRALGELHLNIGGEGPKALRRVSLDELLRGAEGGGAVDVTVSHAERVPNRFHIGVHYEHRGGLPGYTIDGPFPYWFKGTQTRWLPIFASPSTDTHGLVLIANQIFDAAAPRDVTFDVSFHSARTDEIRHAKIFVGAGKTVIERVEDLLPGAAEFLGDEAGWMMLKADVRNHSVVHYAILRGQSSVAVDHAF